MFGREQEITIGPMSGLSNVQYWLRRRGHEVSQDLCESILKIAKQSDHMLTDDEVIAIRDKHLAAARA